ncbi:hypothetical protein MNBD_ALPHA06-1732 [hydrothermal vent metagenome]|uniref:Type IV secretion system protein VirB3 n=1 Tax=hydrothermal vent metagenome TaxID=652676 RepID=A0A3B0S340_9ZZZZ
MKEKDSLFIGMTRPPMIAGVTFLYMGLNAFGAFFAFLLTGNLLYLLVFLPFHAIGYAICLKDPQLLDVMMKKVQKSTGVPNKAFWSGNSYER